MSAEAFKGQKVSLFEIELIIAAKHGDPHQILGMHEMDQNGTGVVAVRAFLPEDSQVFCVDANNEELCYELKMIHFEGFFEAIIPRESYFPYKLRVADREGRFRTIDDAYSFQPTISEYDIYLFMNGTHYEIYSKLGAHKMTHNGVEGVAFAVWAPNAVRVSVVGDFNIWDGRRGAMRNLNKSGVWEIFVPGIGEMEKYKFEIRAANGDVFLKSDPYANYAELRPNTASVVYDIEGYEWNDKKWLEARDKKDYLRSPINIYEVHLGSWKRGEDNEFLTYLELADELIPYVKEMGYTHLELMPVAEHPFDGSWGYQVTGYYAPTSRYGTPKDFMTFVDKCHENGIGVIMDWVPAHFPKDASGLASFDGTSLYEHENPLRGEHPDWGTLIFNYDRKEVANFLISNALFWVEKYHVDGLRVDAVASMLYLDYGMRRKDFLPNRYGGREDFEAVQFLKHLNSILLKRNPGAMMIAEESTSWPGVSAPPENGGLGFNYKWNLGWMNDFLEYITKDPIHRKHFNNNLTFSMMYAYSENYILPFSHDEVVHGKKSLINRAPGDIWQKCANLRLALSFMFGHPGKKLLFMGGEFGQFREWTEAESLEWFMLDYEHHRQIQDFVKDLNHLYLESDAFWYNDYNMFGFQWMNCSRSDLSIVSFARKGEKENSQLLIVCNFTPVVHRDFRVGVPIGGSYKEILNSDHIKYGGSGVTNTAVIESEAIEWDGQNNSISLNVPPLGAAIFKYK